MNRLEKAIVFAAQAHSGQKRKNGSPYILHPLEVCTISATITDDEDVYIACLLHDTVEDTDVTHEDIIREFGVRVAGIVAGDTEKAHSEMSLEDSWLIRKQESLASLADSPREVKIMWLSDKLSNIRSLDRLYNEIGDNVWQRFHQKDKKMNEWYYRSIAGSIQELCETEAYKEFISRINGIFGEEE